MCFGGETTGGARGICWTGATPVAAEHAAHQERERELPWPSISSSRPC
jgi:hypothetical protein